MPRPRGTGRPLAPAGAALTVLVVAACTPSFAGPPAAAGRAPAAPAAPVTSVVARWQEHPEEAPELVREATAVLDELRTGPLELDLPDLTGATSVVVALSCRQLDAPTVTRRGFRGGEDFGQQWIVALHAAPGAGPSGLLPEEPPGDLAEEAPEEEFGQAPGEDVEEAPGEAPGEALDAPPVARPVAPPEEREYGVASRCTAGGEAASGGYQVERTGVPRRVSVTVGPGVRYALGVWAVLPAAP
ncbi:hypothetical protein [Kineococcus gypseus]|uniref:hypothetical protein n=1 Tax=Kineococcus gypseus TaxID=1637102 RepID=UPI003D7D2749